MKIVPMGVFAGRLTNWPEILLPVQAPTWKDVALKLPGVIPVANCSWLTVLEKLGNTWVGLTPSTDHRLPLLPKFPEVPVTGVSIAMNSVSLLPAVPNTQVCVVPDPIGIALPALQVVN